MRQGSPDKGSLERERNFLEHGSTGRDRSSPWEQLGLPVPHPGSWGPDGGAEESQLGLHCPCPCSPPGAGTVRPGAAHVPLSCGHSDSQSGLSAGIGKSPSGSLGPCLDIREFVSAAVGVTEDSARGDSVIQKSRSAQAAGCAPVCDGRPVT